LGDSLLPERLAVVHTMVQNAAQTLDRLHVLVASEQSRLSDLLSSMADGVFLFEESGHIVVMNPIFKTMLSGGSKKGNVQEVVDDLEKGQGGEAGYLPVNLQKVIQKVFLSGEMERTELFCLHQHSYEILAIPVKNHSRGVSGMAFVFHDITARRELDSMKDQFLNTVSHELRTPLTIIKGAAGLLNDGLLGDLNGQQKDTVEMLSAHCDRLGRLIHDLLDLSRLESGKATVRKGKLDVTKLIYEMALSFQTQAKEGSIVLATDLPQGKLPSIYADADMIAQLLTNLINNALRFAKSKITLCAALTKASVESPETNRQVRVSVTDDGQGIATEDQGKLFSKFEQINRPEGGAGYKGTGLGLSICREIVQLNGGKIWVESELGRQTSFHVTLSLYHAEQVFQERLLASLGEAERTQKPLSLVSFTVQNYAELQRAGADDLEDKLQSWGETLQRESLRRNDALFILASGKAVIILLGTPRTEADGIVERVLEATKTLVAKAGVGQPQMEFQLVSAIAAVPEDGKNAQELTEFILGR
jgi:signal transduction histidine kinase